MTVLQTETFHLKPISEEDTEALHGIFTDPHVRKYLMDDEIVPIEFTENEIANSSRLFRKHGYGIWAAFMPDKTTTFGFTGYRHFFEPPELQLLYGLLPDYWGRGYATQMAEIMIHYGFSRLDFQQIIACTDPPNRASERVLQKAGMRFEKKNHRNDMETVYYRLSKADYRNSGTKYNIIASPESH